MSMQEYTTRGVVAGSPRPLKIAFILNRTESLETAFGRQGAPRQRPRKSRGGANAP
jgi:hypothetical protein